MDSVMLHLFVVLWNKSRTLCIFKTTLLFSYFPNSHVFILTKMNRNKITCPKVHMICKRKSLDKSLIAELMSYTIKVNKKVFLNTMWLLKYIYFIVLLNYINIINNYIHKYLFVRRKQYLLTKRSQLLCHDS